MITLETQHGESRDNLERILREFAHSIGVEKGSELERYLFDTSKKREEINFLVHRIHIKSGRVSQPQHYSGQSLFMFYQSSGGGIINLYPAWGIFTLLKICIKTLRIQSNTEYGLATLKEIVESGTYAPIDLGTPLRVSLIGKGAARGGRGSNRLCLRLAIRIG